MKRPKNKDKHSPAGKNGITVEQIPLEEAVDFVDNFLQTKRNEPILTEWESTKRNKEMFIKIYGQTLSTVTAVCQQVGIARVTYYDWLKTDPAFKAAIIEAEQSQHHMVEDQLLAACRIGDGPSVRFYLDRRVPQYKAKQVLEHHVGDRTLEDLLDDDNALPNATDPIGIDRGAAKNSEQAEGSSAVQTERGPEVLLGSSDAA